MAEIKRNWVDGKKLAKKDGGFHRLYMSKRWKQHRLRQLRAHPLCEACLGDNTIRAATIAHHVIDHHGDYALFFSSPLQSLCKPCHDRINNQSHVLGYQRGCHVDGRPYKQHAIFIDHNKSR